GVSASIRRGAITTVIGPNGAGKSTLFKTVFGLLGVRSGRVTFDGADTTSSAPRRMLDAGMCYVPQGRNLFPELSVRHNPDLRGAGVSILMIEQNARQALAIADYGLVLEQGQTRIEDTAANILADPRIAQLFLGGGLAPVQEARP